MIKSFSGQVVLCFAIPEPYLLTLAKTDYPSIVKTLIRLLLIWVLAVCLGLFCRQLVFKMKRRRKYSHSEDI